jgi:allantoinase
MTLPDSYLEYPHRGRGMDHARYPWDIMFRRKPVTWPDGARVALWVTPALQWFPMDLDSKPVAPPGGYNRPYPDFRNYSHREYGLRVGAFRIFRLLDQLGIKASVPMNAAVAERYPVLVEEVNRRGWEVTAHGLHMGRMHYGGLDEAEEGRRVKETVDTLRRITGQPVRGWLSIGKSESDNTPDLIAANGIEYLCDWSNDDMPYLFDTKNGKLYAMPHTQELDDRFVLLGLKHREQEFVQQIKDQFDVLYDEAGKYGGRILSIMLHPWVIGHPYRIRYLDDALRYIMDRKGVWSATGAEILDVFKAQQS